MDSLDIQKLSISERVYLTPEQKKSRKAFRSTLLVHPRLAEKPSTDRPKALDLKAKCPFIYDQGDIGSCTANAICMALVMLEDQKDFRPSRLWLYYKERSVELSKDDKISDSGADAQDGLKILTKQGVCPEDDWPYNTKNCDVCPPAACDTDAVKNKIHVIGTVASDDDPKLVDAIAHSIQLSIPVLIGIEVYSSFESDKVAQNGIVPMPTDNDSYVGGHEVLIVGYNDETEKFVCINSWGSNWGDKGFFYLPYAYVTNPDLTSEFICITKV